MKGMISIRVPNGEILKTIIPNQMSWLLIQKKIGVVKIILPTIGEIMTVGVIIQIKTTQDGDKLIMMIKGTIIMILIEIEVMETINGIEAVIEKEVEAEDEEETIIIMIEETTTPISTKMIATDLLIIIQGMMTGLKIILTRFNLVAGINLWK